MLTEFVCANLQAITNSVGVIFDIVGAFFVATEVVDQFQGKKFKVTPGVARTDYMGSNRTPVVVGQKTEETDEYKGWELKKYWRMKVGLVFLALCFLLQLLSNWITKLV